MNLTQRLVTTSTSPTRRPASYTRHDVRDEITKHAGKVFPEFLVGEEVYALGAVGRIVVVDAWI